MNLRLQMLAVLIVSLLHSKAQPVERMHIHFDKDIYLPGETIWFKAYLYNGGTLSTLSTNFYAAIYDERGRLLQQKIYPISGGTCNGDFVIADTVAISQVRFTAFTKSTLAADSLHLFEKTLTVYNKENTPKNTGDALTNFVSLQFFPEGGNWIAGVNNFIAFKAWYADGTPARVNGVLMDEQAGTVLDSFQANSLGMGKFQFTPEQKTYAAAWKDNTGSMHKTLLPAVQPYGIALHAELTKNELYYHVRKNTGADNFKTLHLLARIDNEELYRADLAIGDRMEWIGKIPRDSLPPGIIQITLFGEQWNPVQERVIFVSPKKDILPQIREEGRNKAGKAKNNIEVIIPDTLFTNMSASIADINFYEKEKNAATIRGELWFAEQVKALHANILREMQNGNEDLTDLVLLTHGWRKYNWTNTAKNQLQENRPADNYLSLQVGYKEGNHGFGKKESLKMIVKDKVSGNQFFVLDPVGQVRFEQTGLIFYDSAKVYYQLAKDKDLVDLLAVKRNEGIKAPEFLAPVTETVWQRQSAKISMPVFFDSLYGRPRKFNEMQTIKEVVVKGKYMNPITKRTLDLDNKYTSGMFSGIARGYQLNVLDDPRAEVLPDLFIYLKTMFPGLAVAGSFGQRKLYPCPMIGYSTCPPLLIFLDEREIEPETLESVPISSIAYAKYIPGIVAGSSFSTGNGVMYLYSKKGDEPSSTPTNMRSAIVKGYDVPKEFFNPDYSDKASLAQPDTRTTLYWNPYLVADKDNRKLKIEYYNNDVSRQLLLTIEGVDAAGRLIHLEKIIE